MIVFLIVVALLTVTALVFLIPPLVRHSSRKRTPERSDLNITVYRDQLAELDRDLRSDTISREQYDQGRLELERRLLEDVAGTEERPNDGSDGNASQKIGWGAGNAAIVVIAVPVLAVGIYMWLGTPTAISPDKTAAPSAGMSEDEHQLDQMVSRLEQRLQEESGNAEDWALLGRSYLAMERFEEARTALEKAISLNDRNPQVLVDYADTLVSATGQSLEGRPMEMIERALELDPNNQKALWLAGTAAYERGDYPLAIEYWQRIYNLVPGDSQVARAMEANIAEVEALMDSEPPRTVDQASSTDTAGTGKVTGTVRLSADIREQVEVDASDSVFIFARAPQGPRMPLAVLRAQVKDLPLEYTLDDSMAMDPSMSISKFSEVVIVAHISKSGDAMARSGDLQGKSPVVRSGSVGAEVVIDEVVP